MKGILRGLSNAIFRKLPIKFLLILLAVFSVVFAFCSASDLPTSSWYSQNPNGNYIYGGLYTYITDSYSSNGRASTIDDSVAFVCMRRGSAGAEYSLDGSTWLNLFNNDLGCTDSKTIYIKGTAIFYYFFYSKGYVPGECSSQQCQLDYNLIPIESVNQQYCVSNNLCPSSDCPIYTGDSSWSALYINDIQHVGAGIIDITIPSEISWDYTNENNIFNLDIEGYNVNEDYINAIIGTQTYTPNETDFSKVVSEIIPLFVPGLVIILFLYFVFRFIKKIF